MEHDELSQYLDSLEREDAYRVDKVLKESEYETTQLVYFAPEGLPEQGPFVRKFIQNDKGLGAVYERIYRAEQEGHRFKHIPRIIECYKRDDDLVVLMEHVVGETLLDLVYHCDPSTELAYEVFPQLCSAVMELHEEFETPIIHRDLKPSNVIVSGIGSSHTQVTLIDFGIAREYRKGGDADTNHFGTFDFAPPEQFGYGQTDESSDVYALGLLLFFCLTERIPTASERQEGYHDPRLSESMRTLIVQATAFDPKRRFKSVRALKSAFESVVRNENASTTPAETTPSAPRSDAQAPYVQPPNAQMPNEQPPYAQTPSVQQPHPRTATASEPRTHASYAQPPYAQGTRISYTKHTSQTPQIVGRVWNAIVIVSSVALAAESTRRFVTGGAFNSQHEPLSPSAAIAVYVCVMTLLALFAIACLDKRRLREKYSQLAGIQWWQYWAVFFIGLVLYLAFHQLLG